MSVSSGRASFWRSSSLISCSFESRSGCWGSVMVVVLS